MKRTVVARELSTADERLGFDVAYADARLLGRWGTRRGNVLRAVWWRRAQGEWVVVLEWQQDPRSTDEREFRTVIGPAIRRRTMELLEAMLPVPMLARETATRWELRWPESAA